MKSSEIRLALLRTLADTVDAQFAAVGFIRSPKGIEYRRKLPDAIQALHVHLAVRPNYSRGALAHAYPRIRLSLPSVCQTAAELVAGNPVLLAHASEIIINRPLEHLVPKVERVQWYAFDGSDFTGIVREIVAAYFKWGLPFLDGYRTAQDIVRGFEAGDARLRWQENSVIFGAAAMLVEGDRQRAYDFLNATFRSPGLRRKYAVVFSNLELICRRSHDARTDAQPP